jgi:Mg/Co/Ni transporter MgtE
MINHSNENVLMDDANSPEINQKLMGKVSSDFIKVSEHLKEASYQIIKRKFSENPIFILTENPIEIGATLFQQIDFKTTYEYRASFLEEFISRNMIGEESVEFFKENYKDPEEYCCLFVIDQAFAGFIYLPFPND